jgi:hypothetical protein
MIVWIPIAVNEKEERTWAQPYLPEYSAAVIGSSVVLRVYGGGGYAPLRAFTGGLSFALTTIPFATRDEAQAWIDANRAEIAYERQPARTADQPTA